MKASFVKKTFYFHFFFLKNLMQMDHLSFCFPVVKFFYHSPLKKISNREKDWSFSSDDILTIRHVNLIYVDIFFYVLNKYLTNSKENRSNLLFFVVVFKLVNCFFSFAESKNPHTRRSYLSTRYLFRILSRQSAQRNK